MTLRLLLNSLILPSILMGLASNQTSAATLRIEFSGTFLESSGTPNSPLEGLLNQPFEGVVEVPYQRSAAPPEIDSTTFPFPADRARYLFEEPSFMSISTGVDQFGLVNKSPVRFLVHDCNVFSCAFIWDYMEFLGEDGLYVYTLRFGAPKPILESVAYPFVDQFRSSVVSVGITTTDLEHFVYSDYETSPVITNVSVIRPEFQSESMSSILPLILLDHD